MAAAMVILVLAASGGGDAGGCPYADAYGYGTRRGRPGYSVLPETGFRKSTLDGG